MIGALSGLLAAGCGGGDPVPPRTAPAGTGTTSEASPVAAAVELGATPLALDERGVPRLLAGGPVLAGATPTAIAIAQAQRLAPAWGVHAAPELVSLGEVPVLGGTIVRLRQDIDGIPVDADELHVFVRPSGELVAISGTMVGRDAPRTAARFIDDDAGAIARAVRHQYHAAFDAKAFAVQHRRANGPRMFTGHSGAIDVQLASAHRVWHRSGDRLIAAWVAETYASDQGSTRGDAFHTVLAGEDGRVLEHRSIVADAAFQYRVFAETTGEYHPVDGPTADATPHPAGVPNADYPPFVAPSLVSIDGLDHLERSVAARGRDRDQRATTSDCYADFNAPDGLSAGDFRASATSANAFDRVYDTAAEPLASTDEQMAAITSLFYTVNWLHDFWYDRGFIETAGNAQADNYGRGGVDRRPDARRGPGQRARWLAQQREHVDAGGRHVAAHADVSCGPAPSTLALTAGANTPATASAAFGPKNFNLTGTLVLANDGPRRSPTPASADRRRRPARSCSSIAARARSRPRRSTSRTPAASASSSSTTSTSTSPVAMGDDATITTAITIRRRCSVTRATRSARCSRPASVTATMQRASGVELDGTLDASVIAHEFGHYLHHRLSSCGTRRVRRDERGLGRLRRADADGARRATTSTARIRCGIYSTMSLSADAAYYGIRRAPYSADPAINALSFRHMTDGVAAADHASVPVVRQQRRGPQRAARSGPRRCGTATSRSRRQARRSTRRARRWRSTSSPAC